MKYKYFYFLISALFLIPCLFSLVSWSLEPAIDFSGGSILEIKDPDLAVNKNKLEEVVKSQGLEQASIKQSGEGGFILRMKEIDKDKKEEILEEARKEFDQIKEVRFETVGPTIGQELIRKTVVAVLLAAGFILVYLTLRFKDKKYGVCALLAMFHDTFILIGVFSLLGHFFDVKVDTLFVTAVLTILSFSVHDTIVVYDRIRESIRLKPKAEFEDLVNKAVAETLTRSVNNSMTIIFMLLCLYLLGGQTIKWFIFALLVGTILGTYSSTFTAAPLLVVWEDLKAKKE